jgi:Carboxypeptidase regulatory-like domain
MNALLVQLRSTLRASGARLRGEAGFGLVEAVIAMTLFLVVGTAMADVLSSSATSHGFTMDQTLGQEAADAQIEDVRALPYDSVGTTSGNPPGSVAPTQSATAVGITGLAATVTTSIHFVGDGIPSGYNSTTNYKQVVVSVTRTSDGRNLATESTYIAPPTRAPYGGISQVALGVIATDIGDNQPVPGVPIALQTGPSAPRSDTTDTNGGVLFAGMTANPTSGSTMYYNVVPTIPPGYLEMPGDVKQAHLGPGQITNLSIRLYQPATIYVNLTTGGSTAYTGNATVTVTPASGTPQTYSVGGDPGGAYSIPNIIPNSTYTVTASNSAGLISKAVAQLVPNDYPDDLTSTFALDLAAPTGTLSVTALNGTTPIAGVGVKVTGGPSGVTLNGTTDANGVANFPSIPAGTATYTVTGTYGAATFQKTGVTVATNQPTAVTLGVNAGAVKVSVTDSSSHPLPGATLTLTGPNGFSAVAPTDGTGTYTFPNVGTGTGYSVTATDGAATATTTGITVATGATTNVVMSLSVGTIKVTVTDGSNPLANIPVTLTGPHSLVVIGTTVSDGTYSFTNVGAGSGYTVSAADGAATATSGSLTVTAGLTTPASLTLSVGSIKATITEGGSPLANAKVTVTGPNAYSVTQTASAGGVVTFTGVGAGSGYTVTAADGPASAQKTSVSVSGSSTTNVAIDIPAGSLKVTVTAGGSAISGVTVTVTGPNSYSATGTTNASGIYTFASIPGGSNFTVTGTIGGSSASQTAVSVASGAETDVSLALPTGSIRTSVLIGGQPLAGQTVTVTGPGSFSASGKTDATGLYVLTNVPVGTGYTVATVYGSTVQQTGQSVAKNTRTDVLLSIPAGSLKVTVQNQSGTAIQGADVALTSTNGVTAPDGTTLSDGTYVFSVPAASGYKLTASFGAGSITSASQTVTNGATTSVTLTLATGSIKVTVQNSAGTTYSGAGLTLTGPNSFSATGTTTSAGVFTFSGIPTGTSAYSVAATYAGASANATGISVSSGATTSTTVTIPTGSIKVTVTAGGSNVGGSAVTVTYPGGFTASGTTASGSGSVTLNNVPAGTGYTVSATDAAATGTATGVNVTSGNTTSSTVAIPVGSLAVTATVAGSPVGGAAVTVTYPGGFSATGTTVNSGPSLGTVTLTNIPAGSGYSISATSNGATGTTTGAVTSGSTTAATVVIPTGSIVVTVKNQSGTSLNGASLTLTGPGSYSATGSTGSGSTYTFPNVPINATGYTVTGTLGAGTGSTPGVVVSSTSPKAATVTINTGSIAVTVKDQNSAAVNGGNLTLTGPGSYSATGSPGSGNTYTFTLVPVGTSSYTVAAAVGAGSGSTPGVVVSATTPAKAAAVTVNTSTVAITVDGSSPTCSKRGNVVVTLSGAQGYSATATTSNVTGSGKGIATFNNVPTGSPYTATDSSGDTTSSVIASPPSGTVILSPQAKC